MEFSKVFKNITQLSLGLFFLSMPIMCWADDSLSNTIKQSVKGTKIIDFTVAPVPRSAHAVKLSIQTNAGQKHIILSERNVKVALQTLENPHISGKHNAKISSHIINHNPVLLHYVAPMHVTSSSKHPVRITKSPIPSAAAIATTAALSSNQQASR